MEIPEVDVAPLPAPRAGDAIVEPEVPLLARLSGAWEQIDVAAQNAADFAPGGYSSSVLAIVGTSGEMFVYRGFGAPSASACMFISGQFSVAFSKDGWVTIGPSKLKPTTFSATERLLPVPGGTPVVMTPPAKPVVSATWDTKADDGTEILEIGGKSYKRASDRTYESVVRGEPVELGETLSAGIAKAETSTAPGPAVGTPGGQSSLNVDFFGTKVRGRYIAFVLDNSGSMAESGKIEAAISELRRCISALPRETNVYVVFFNSGAFELKCCSGWIPTGSSRCGQLFHELGEVGAGGGTNPEPALRRSFSLGVRPDELFFMTDGLMPPDVASVIAQLNGQSRARTRVHTFAFGPDADRNALSAIAGANDGQFRAVP